MMSSTFDSKRTPSKGYNPLEVEAGDNDDTALFDHSLSRGDSARVDTNGVELDNVPTVEDDLPWSVRIREVFFSFLTFGFIAFGGPQAHVALLHERFVEKKKWLDENRFLELLGLGQGMPGPTSTQMVVAIGIVRAGPLGGLLAFLLFLGPGFLVCLFVGLGVQKLEDKPGGLPDWYYAATVGLAPAAISQVFLAAYQLGSKVCGSDNLKIALALFAAICSTVVKPAHAAWMFPALMFGGGLITYLDYRFNRWAPASRYPAAKTDDTHTLQRIGISPIGGLVFLAVWAGLLIFTVIVRRTKNMSDELDLFEAMYRLGSIIFGGGQVVLPMLSTEVVDKGWVTKTTFLNGLGLVQGLPGPLFNLSTYLGAAFLGYHGAIIAFLGLFGPGALLVYAMIPFWERCRNLDWVRTGFVGVNAAAIGLVVAATAILWRQGVYTLGGASVAIFAGALCAFYKVPAPFAIIAGGFMGWILMMIDVGGPYCIVPHYVRAHPEWNATCTLWQASHHDMH